MDRVILDIIIGIIANLLPGWLTTKLRSGK